MCSGALINNDGSFNDNVEKDISKVKSEDNLCREEFYTYRAELTPEHQKILNELRQQKILNDKLQTEIYWQKNNQPQNYIVRNRTIRNEFNKALQAATEELDIVSAWINFNVVNESLQQSFENLLRRGVTIKILYGIGDMGLFTADSRNRRTNEVAAHLKKRFKNYPNFKMKCTNTHEKLFICDEKFYVHSSMNILSFSATYNTATCAMKAAKPQIICNLYENIAKCFLIFNERNFDSDKFKQFLNQSPSF